jgi:hypothetical protein
MTIQNIYEVKEFLALIKGIDTLEVTERFYVRKGDRTCTRHGYATSVIQVRERLPNPEKVSVEDGFVLQRLDLDTLLCPDLFEPVLILGLRSLRPIEIA